MDIFISRGERDPEIRIRFPAEPDSVWPMLAELDEHCASNDPVRIVGAFYPIPNRTQYISGADMEQEADIRKLNALAGLVDTMGAEERRIFSGALDAESVNGLDDVLGIASSLDRYEFIEGLTSDKDLGGWLVEHGKAEVDFPKEVWPYLDYAGIGAAYYASHGGAYTPIGYVKRREAAQTQKETDRPAFALTLASPAGAVLLDLPASDDALEQAKRMLRLEDLDSATIQGVEIGYPWAHLLPTDAVTVEDANVLAECVQGLAKEELRVFGAVLEVEEPRSFHEAGTIAMDLTDYELTTSSEREYAIAALGYAGAGDEVVEMLDGFTDFEALGRSEMEADGVRETSFGSVRRLSAPWPCQEPEMGQTMG